MNTGHFQYVMIRYGTVQNDSPFSKALQVTGIMPPRSRRQTNNTHEVDLIPACWSTPCFLIRCSHT
jgi:hypothetical protein